MPENVTTAATGTPAEPGASAQPQAGSSGTTAASANTGTQAEPTSASPSGDYMSLDEAKKLRSESSSLRKRLADLEAAQKAVEDAKLSESEKAAKRLAELERTNTTQARELTELKLTRAIERQAAALNIIDPDAAAKLLDWAEIDFDASGAPKNLDKLLAALVQAKPWLVSSAAARPAVGSGGATKPGALARPGTFTREQIAKMSTAEYEQNRAAIMESLKTGALRP